MPLAPDQEQMLINLLIQEDLERVSPKLEAMRGDYIIKGARGGRGAGAKSWSMTSLVVQEANYTTQRVACLREIQESLEESVYELVQKTVERLRYPRWKFTREYAESPTGSKFIFRGLKDMRASRNIKGLEGFTRFFIEEAAPISDESWDVLLPTLFRTKGAQLLFCYNPETETDPVTRKVWLPYINHPKVKLIELRPGREDNPWFNDVMVELSEKMRREDPDLWAHVYGGLPRKQGQRAVMSRIDIRVAMERTIQNPEGETEIGVDVARFGDDKTVIIRRVGMSVVQQKELSGADTQLVAREVWDIAHRDKKVKIKVDDTGVGGGVTDKLKDLGANVIPVNFGAVPSDPVKYTSVADEMWFDFPLAEACIPDDPQLFEELAGREYEYTSKEQRKIESKKDFKKRLGRSPDHADALLLCFYRPKESTFAMGFV
jgi:phage terminase large subunit